MGKTLDVAVELIADFGKLMEKRELPDADLSIVKERIEGWVSEYEQQEGDIHQFARSKFVEQGWVNYSVIELPRIPAPSPKKAEYLRIPAERLAPAVLREEGVPGHGTGRAAGHPGIRRRSRVRRNPAPQGRVPLHRQTDSAGPGAGI